MFSPPRLPSLGSGIWNERNGRMHGKISTYERTSDRTVVPCFSESGGDGDGGENGMGRENAANNVIVRLSLFRVRGKEQCVN